jgi:hypothetical protein
MRFPARNICSCFLFSVMALLGCRAEGPGGGDEAASGPKVRQVAASELPSLGDPSPTSDPAVQAAGPQGWKRLPRNDDEYLIGWYGGSNPSILPRIFIRAEEWTGHTEVTNTENVIALAEELEQSLAGQKEKVIEPPQGMLLAGEPWVRFVEKARLGNAAAEKQILRRVVGSRIYTVELQIYVGKILESRDQAYAVAAGLEFSEPAAAPAGDASPPGESPPKDSLPESTAADPAAEDAAAKEP